jgi:hypothetical protein
LGKAILCESDDEEKETEIEVARIESDEFAVPETLGRSLAEGNA